MIIRKVKPEELKRTNELFAIAFEFGEENDKTAQEVYEEIINNPKSREDVYWGERWAAFEDDDTTMMSFFIAQPFPVNFDGATYSMTGIGGVASCHNIESEAVFEAVLKKPFLQCMKMEEPFLIYILFLQLIIVSLVMRCQVQR